MICLALATLQQPPPPRFELAAPLPGITWAKIDSSLADVGIAHTMARAHGLQARVLWIDGTANLVRVDTVAEIRSLVSRVAEIGFNTIVFDVKPIVGRTLYPSALTEQITSWKGQEFPLGFDPVAPMVAACREEGISILLSLNAFAEGHSYARRDAGDPDSLFGDPGWGYEHPDLQSVRYDPVPAVRAPDGSQWEIGPDLKLNAGVGDVVIRLDDFGRIGPEGGNILTATGRAAEWLAQVAEDGARLELIPVTRYLRAAEEQDQIPLMMNPHEPAVIERALAFVQEVARYQPDGILLDDRFRYGGLGYDFSPETIEAFEKWVGEPLSAPEDVYTITFNWSGSEGIRPGKYFDAWLAFRALRMKDVLLRFRALVDRALPNGVFGIYAGSWYGAYPNYGINYASPEMVGGFPFLTKAFRQAGFAGVIDLLIAGAYYPVPTMYAALERATPIGRTVEAAGILTNRVVADRCWSYAGIQLSDYWGRERELELALQAATATTQGVMVFDLSHRFDEYADMFARAFAEPATPPHSRPGLLAEIQRRRESMRRQGYEDPPVPFLPGSPSAGF